MAVAKRRSMTGGVPPDLLRIEEAARVLQISRTTAYALARKYLASNGTEGLPAVWIGGQLRVPTRALEEGWVGGRITWPIPDHESAEAAGERSSFTALDGGHLSPRRLGDARRSRRRSK